jgi:uncharacterized protein (DUF2141 family)
MLSSAGAASSIDVQVIGAPSDDGSIRCAVFLQSDGFPDDGSKARLQVLAASVRPLICRFDDIPASRIAIAISHDGNGNGKLDTNFLGIPKEAWGVSRGVRPSLRAPRFEQAAVEFDGNPMSITIEVAR